VVPKQRKEYQKKDPQPKLVEGPTDKFPIGANAWSLLGHLASDKIGGVEDDFTNMPPLEDASNHDKSPIQAGVVHSYFEFPRTGDAKEFTYCYASQGLRVTFIYDSY